MVVLFLTFLVAALIVILKDDLVNKKIDELENQLLDYVGERAFALESVTVKGRQKTKLADINSTMSGRAFFCLSQLSQENSSVT